MGMPTQPVPAEVLSDREALARICAINPNFVDNPALELRWIGTKQSGVPGTAAQEGRWVWRVLGIYPGPYTGSRRTRYVGIDAVTGAALSTPGGALPAYINGDKQSRPRLPR